MDEIVGLLRNLRPPKQVKVVVNESASSADRQKIAEQAQQLRVHGRPHGTLQKQVGEEVVEAGRPWPKVIEHQNTDTLEVPATFEGMLALLTTWDSHLLNGELQVLNNVVHAMVPAGIKEQEYRSKMIQREALVEEHQREHHSEWVN